MNEIVRYKRPAVVAHQLPTRVDTVVGTKRQIALEIRRLQELGQLADSGNRRLITHGEHAGKFEQRLILIDRPPRKPPVWARACSAFGLMLLGLASVVGSLAWLLSSLSGTALALLLTAALVAFVSWLKVRFGGGRPRVTVTTTTVVDVR